MKQCMNRWILIKAHEYLQRQVSALLVRSFFPKRLFAKLVLNSSVASESSNKVPSFSSSLIRVHVFENGKSLFARIVCASLKSLIVLARITRISA